MQLIQQSLLGGENLPNKTNASTSAGEENSIDADFSEVIDSTSDSPRVYSSPSLGPLNDRSLDLVAQADSVRSIVDAEQDGAATIDRAIVIETETASLEKQSLAAVSGGASTAFANSQGKPSKWASGPAAGVHTLTESFGAERTALLPIDPGLDRSKRISSDLQITALEQISADENARQTDETRSVEELLTETPDPGKINDPPDGGSSAIQRTPSSDIISRDGSAFPNQNIGTESEPLRSSEKQLRAAIIDDANATRDVSQYFAAAPKNFSDSEQIQNVQFAQGAERTAFEPSTPKTIIQAPTNRQSQVHLATVRADLRVQTEDVSQQLTTTKQSVAPVAFSIMQFANVPKVATVSSVSVGAVEKASELVFGSTNELAIVEFEETIKLATVDRARPEPIATRSIVNQVVHAISRAPGEAVVEVRLQPEELGRVRLSMSPAEVGMTVQITAERPETLDLLRRNIDALEHELKQNGFKEMSFSFGSETSDEPENPQQRDRSLSVAQGHSERGDNPPLNVNATRRFAVTEIGRVDVRI